jgi:hypothetical protein
MSMSNSRHDDDTETSLREVIEHGSGAPVSARQVRELIVLTERVGNAKSSEKKKTPCKI